MVRIRARSPLTLMTLLLLATSAWANGKYWPRVAFPETPRIPLQRAMIVYRDGVETLILESSVETDSPEVGWVVPLPAEPTTLEPVDPGLLTSMSLTVRPRIIDDLGLDAAPPFILFGNLFWAALIMIFIRRWRYRVPLLLLLALWMLAATATFSCSGSNAGRAAPAVTTGITMQRYERVGDYDVAVLKAESPEAFDGWLAENDLHRLDESEKPVIADYIARGWCFMVAMLDVRNDAVAHPICARFGVQEPVYPMKLTGLANSDTRVQLFVVADRQGDVEDFHTAVAARFAQREDDYRGLTGTLIIGSPDAEQYLWDDCIVTRLEADLSPAQMDHDLRIQRTDYGPHRDVHFSRRGRYERLMFELFWACVILVIALGFILGRETRRPSLRGALLWVALAAVLAAALTARHLLTPVVETRRAKGARREVGFYADDVADGIRKLVELGVLHAEVPPERLRHLPELLDTLDYQLDENPYTGERMRMERSPGNFSIIRTDNGTFIGLYGMYGHEERIALPPPDNAGRPDQSPSSSQ